MVSVFNDSRVTTPWRARSCCVTAATHFVDSWARAFRRAVARLEPSRSISVPDQRPPAFGRRRRQAARSKRRDLHPPELGLPARRARAGEGAQRVKRVVGDQPVPDQIPERVDGLGGEAAAGGLEDRREERRAALAQAVEDGDLARGEIVIAVRLTCPTSPCFVSIRLRRLPSAPAAAAAADDRRDTARCGRRARRAARRRPRRLLPPR